MGPLHRNVFSLENGTAVCFEIVPKEALMTGGISKLGSLIQAAGGIVLKPYDSVPNAVKILDLQWYLDRNLGPPLEFPDDVYSPSFVVDSYIKDRMQDLIKYSLREVTIADANLVALPEVRLTRIPPVERNGALLRTIGVPSNPKNPLGSRSVHPVSVEEIFLGPADSPKSDSSTRKGSLQNSKDVDDHIPSLLSPGRTMRTTVPATGTEKVLSYLQAIESIPVMPSSSDDDDSADKKQLVSRKKFFRTKRHSSANKSDKVEEPEEKKQKQNNGSFSTRIYSAARLYFNATSPQKNSIQTKACSTSAMTSRCGEVAVLSGHQENIPQDSSRSKYFRDDGSGSDTLPSRSKSATVVSTEIKNIPRNNFPISTKVPIDLNKVNAVKPSIRNATIAKPRENTTRVISDNNFIQRSAKSAVQDHQVFRSNVRHESLESSDEDIAMPPSPDRMSTTSSRSKRPYSVEEGQTLLQFICDNNLHSYHSGMKPWRKAEEEELLTDRSASSMWEHFRKKVYPNRQKIYGCSKIDMNKFALGEKLKGQNRKTPAPNNILYKK